MRQRSRLSSHLISHLRATLSVAALATFSACASQPAPAPAAPAPTAAQPAAPTISQTCPGPADGPSMVVQAVEDARRVMSSNPTGPVPPVCLVTAFTRVPIVVPDSITEHALGIATELDRRGMEPRELLAGEITLLARLHRSAELLRAYGRLTAIDPQPPLAVMRLAISAAYQAHDTTTLIRVLSTAEIKSDAPPSIRAEHNVLRQVGALHTAINEARGFIRQNPKYLAAYPSLVGNFGSLGDADSVVAYIGRALRQGVTRATLTPAIDPLVNAMLRHASLYGSGYAWDAQIAAAKRVDSALTSPSTKFLVAALIAQSVEQELGELGARIQGSTLGPVLPGSRPSTDASMRAAACQRIPALLSSLDVASARLREGGDRYAGGGVQQLTSGISAEREQLGALRDACAK